MNKLHPKVMWAWRIGGYVFLGILFLILGVFVVAGLAAAGVLNTVIFLFVFVFFLALVVNLHRNTYKALV